MNIALAQSEIAQFLEFSLQEVFGLWERRILKRSIHVDYRSNPELSHSSVFDVLEFYVRNEVLGGDGADAEVEAWLCAVDALVESRNWEGRDFDDMVPDLVHFYSEFSTRPCGQNEAAIRASQVLAAYFNLLRFVEPDSHAYGRYSRAA